MGWTAVNWDEMVLDTIGSSKFQEALREILDAIEEQQGFGHSEPFEEVLDLVAKSPFQRERVNNTVEDIVNHAAKLVKKLEDPEIPVEKALEDFAGRVLADLQAMLAVYVVVGGLAGLRAADHIKPLKWDSTAPVHGIN